MTCSKCPRRTRSRGLCQSCYLRAYRNQTICDYERRTRPIAEVVEECQALAGEAVETIAARLGYASRDSLYHTLHYNDRLDVWRWLKREATA